jgi:hypothetical protein
MCGDETAEGAVNHVSFVRRGRYSTQNNRAQDGLWAGGDSAGMRLLPRDGLWVACGDAS